jgi:sialidase-1
MIKNWCLVFLVLCSCVLYSKAQPNVLPYDDYLTIRNGLPHFYTCVHTTHKATVAFVGGSITFNPGWRDKLCVRLKERYPGVTFAFVTAAIPSLGSVAHVFRLHHDLLDSVKPDLVFVEAAVNDRGNGTDSITQLRALDGIVRQIKKSNPATDVVLISLADPDKTNDYNHGRIPVEIANHEAVAAHYFSPSVNLGKEVRDKINNKELDWNRDFKDIHPAEYGQNLYYLTISRLLDTCLSLPSAGTGKPAGRLPAALNKASFEAGHYYDLVHAKTDTSWTLDQNWAPNDGLSTRDGFVHVPMLIANRPGATLDLPFKGTAVGIAVVAGGDAGTISYAIDNAPFKEIDLYTVHSSWLHLPCYLLLGSDLKNTRHQLHIRINDHKNNNSKGHACRIVHFLVNGQP